MANDTLRGRGGKGGGLEGCAEGATALRAGERWCSAQLGRERALCVNVSGTGLRAGAGVGLRGADPGPVEWWVSAGRSIA